MLSYQSVGAAIALVIVAAGCSAQKPDETTKPAPQKAEPAGVLNLYSARHYDNDQKIYAQFTEETGIKINEIEGRGDALIERMASEGSASPADVFLTADAGILWRAQTRGLFAATDDPVLNAAIPAPFRHPQGYWYGLTKRARIVVYDKQAGLPEGLNDYADLVDPAYKGMICVRPSSNIYNQSLLASIIANDGEEAAQSWAAGVVENFARKPQGNDTAQIEAVAAGICRLAIVNSYYVARFVQTDDPKNKAIGARISVLFPNQGTAGEPGRGTHVNVSGGGIAKHAPNAENAAAFLRFLARADIQASFASGNNEFPIRTDVAPIGPVTEFGAFREDQLPVTALGENQRKAVEIFDRVGWL